MKSKIIIPVICLLFLVACSDVKEEQQQESVSQEEYEELPIVSDSSLENPEVELEEEEEYLNRFDHIDIVKEILSEWNRGINQHTVDMLEPFYAPKVQYYKSFSSAKNCVNAKEVWLAKHEGYHQCIENLSLYYPYITYEDSLIAVEFDKLCIENGNTTTVSAYMELERQGKQWKIIKESDVISEISLALSQPNVVLLDGEHEFNREYWIDTREDEVLAHDMVSYRNYITIKKDGNEYKGEIARYSGSLRHWIHWNILKGEMDDGVLHLMTYMVPEDYEDWEPDTTDLDTLSYKIIDQNTLIDLKDYFGTEGMIYN